MKANHNTIMKPIGNQCVVFNISKIQDESKSQHVFMSSDRYFVVFNISKIQDESKSQHLLQLLAFIVRCFQYFKDTR